MKRLIHSFLLRISVILLLFSFSAQIRAENLTNITILGRDDCTHCQDEMEFLDELSTQRSDFRSIYIDITDKENQVLWKDVTTELSLPKVTPVTLIGETIIQGFDTKETTGKSFSELLDFYQQQPTEIDSFEAYLAADLSKESKLIENGTCPEEECVIPETGQTISVPFFGTIKLSNYSLPALAAILGFVDGFNPCAMWVLVTFLLILMQLKSRKKMFIFAGLFILAEAIMYTLILTVWYTAWDFVGLDRIVTPLIGLMALGGGAFFLYEWKTSKPGECKVTNSNQRQKLKNKITDIVSKPLSLSSIVGIIFVAFSVNVIEFACSIGIPQTFTKILEINQLSPFHTASLIFIYIIMYMVDDFIVFGLALYSFEKIGLTSKYSKISNLIGGLLLLLLGTILILNPSLLRMI